MPINNTITGRNFKNARKITKAGTIKSIGDIWKSFNKVVDRADISINSFELVVCKLNPIRIKQIKVIINVGKVV